MCLCKATIINVLLTHIFRATYTIGDAYGDKSLKGNGSVAITEER
jgi:hypothetical protein